MYICITIVPWPLCVYKRRTLVSIAECTVVLCVTHVQCVAGISHTLTHASLPLCLSLFSLYIFVESFTFNVNIFVCLCEPVYVRMFHALNFLSLAQKSIWLVAIASRTINGMRVEVSFVNKKKVCVCVCWRKREAIRRHIERERKWRDTKKRNTRNHNTKQRLMF